MSNRFDFHGFFPKEKVDGKSIYQQCLARAEQYPLFSKDVNGKGAKTFFACGYERFCHSHYNYILRKHVYELINPNLPCKIYLDFDEKDTSQSEAFEQSTSTFVDHALSKLPTGSTHHIMVSDNPRKLSKHVIINVFLKDLETVKAFVYRCHDSVPCPSLDLNVYTPFRSFRLLYSSKWGADPSTALRIEGNDSYDSELLLDTLIQAFDKTKHSIYGITLLLPKMTDKQPTSKRRKLIAMTDTTSGIADNLYSMIQLFSETGHVQVYRFEEFASMSRMIVKGIPCPSIGRQHKSNNTYVYIMKGTNSTLGYFCCADPDCNERRFNKFKYASDPNPTMITWLPSIKDCSALYNTVKSCFKQNGSKLIPDWDFTLDLEEHFSGKMNVGANETVFDVLRDKTWSNEIKVRHDWFLFLHLDKVNQVCALFDYQYHKVLTMSPDELKFYHDSTFTEQEAYKYIPSGDMAFIWYAQGKVTSVIYGPVVMSGVVDYFITGDPYHIENNVCKLKCIDFLKKCCTDFVQADHFPVPIKRTEKSAITLRKPKLYLTHAVPTHESLYAYYIDEKRKAMGDQVSHVYSTLQRIPSLNDQSYLYVVVSSKSSFTYRFPFLQQQTVHLKDVSAKHKKNYKHIVLVFKSKWEQSQYVHGTHAFIQGLSRIDSIFSFFTDAQSKFILLDAYNE